jgi:hypothetical protein
MSVRPLTLNHAELVHPVGGRAAAEAALTVMGFNIVDWGQWSAWIVATLGPAGGKLSYVDDVLVVSEVTPVQQRFNDSFARAVGEDPELAASYDRYGKLRGSRPQFFYHFGISIPTHEEWEERVARIEEAGRNHPLLAGKIEIAGRFEPGDPGAITPLSQAFVRTTALAAEVLSLGWQVEYQWAPLDENGDPDGRMLGEIPDISALA